MTDMPLDTLEKLAHAKNYNEWIHRLLRPYLGQRILEIGCGIGNMTGFLLCQGQVLATDMDVERVRAAQARWSEHIDLSTALWDIAEAPPEAVRDFKTDTIVCVNILEHVQDDLSALININRVLPVKGRCILFVPAVAAVFGSLDKELRHFRRYNRKDLIKLVERAGFRVEVAHFVNFFGVPGWWWVNCVLRQKKFSPSLISVYDRLIPFFAWLEARVKPIIGQSLFCVAVKIS